MNCDTLRKSKITQRANDRRYHFWRQSGKHPSQHEQIAKLTEEVSRSEKVISKQQDEIAKLRDEVNRQQEDITRLNAGISTTLPPKCRWQVFDNLETLCTQPNVLLHAGNAIPAIAQSFDSLKPGKSFFKIHILNLAGQYNSIVVGLTRKGHPVQVQPGQTMGSISYRSNGKVDVDEESETVKETCKNGDVIECGITFLASNGVVACNVVEVYFLKNGQLITKKLIKMPQEGLFPTVGMARIHNHTVPMVEYCV